MLRGGVSYYVENTDIYRPSKDHFLQQQQQITCLVYYYFHRGLFDQPSTNRTYPCPDSIEPVPIKMYLLHDAVLHSTWILWLPRQVACVYSELNFPLFCSGKLSPTQRSPVNLKLDLKIIRQNMQKEECRGNVCHQNKFKSPVYCVLQQELA